MFGVFRSCAPMSAGCASLRGRSVQAIFGVAFLIGAWTREERYHKGLLSFGIAAFVLYIVLLYARMQ